MTITQKNYDGDGSTTQFTIGFPYLQQSDIKASINGADTSFTFVSGDILSVIMILGYRDVKSRSYTHL